MAVGRILSGLAASVAVAGSAVAVIAMAHARPGVTAAHETRVPTPTNTPRPAHPPIVTSAVAPSSTAASTSPNRRTPVARATPRSTTASITLPAAVAPTHLAPRTTAPPAVRRSTATTHAPKPAPRTTAAPRPSGTKLPLGYSTGNATRVITVVGRSSSSTTATLQAWVKSGSGWAKWGPAITAHVGADGIGQPSEYRSATPAGSFTLTQAFGYYGDPGTGLPYFKTTWADWWISTAGSQYNTHQRCSSCGYKAPDEHLVTETPYYNYAVVINTPSGANAYPQGSAFFLHVTDGNPTAGCVAIPQANLVNILRWLAPWSHPRILIGVA